MFGDIAADLWCNEVAGEAKTHLYTLERAPLNVSLIVIKCIEFESILVLVPVFEAKSTTELNVTKEQRCVDSQAVKDEKFEHHPALHEEDVLVFALAWIM